MLQSVLESILACLVYSRVVSFVCFPFKDHFDDCFIVCVFSRGEYCINAIDSKNNHKISTMLIPLLHYSVIPHSVF